MATSETEIRISVAGTPEAVRAVMGVHAALAELQRVGGVATRALQEPVDAHQLEMFGEQVASVSRDLKTVDAAAGEARQGLNELVPPKVSDDLKKVKFGLSDVVRAAESMSGSLSTHVSAPLAAAGGFAIKTAIDLEQAAAGVRKTTNLSSDALAQLVADFKRMSELPGRPAADELLGIAEAAGQLGVQSANLEGFAETVAALRVSTNLVGEEGTQDLARFGNVMQTAQTDFDRLGSTIVALGNDGASTEAEILDMALQIAGAGKQVGLTEGEVLGFANALSSVGIGAEAGGTAISRVMMEIDKSVATGGSRLDSFARVAGLSAEQFRRAYQEDAAGAVITFIEGLRRLSNEGGNVFQILEGVEFQDIRVQKALLAAAGAGDLFRKSLVTGNQAWKENIALTREAEGFYNTTGGELLSAQHVISDVAGEIGTALTPAIRDAAGAVRILLIPVREMVEVFGDLPAPIRETAAGLGLFVVAGPPTLWFFSSLSSTVLTAVEAVRKFRAARAAATVAEVGAEAVTAAAGLSTLGGILLPGGALLIGLGLLATAFHEARDGAKEAAEEATAAVKTIKAALPQLDYDALKDRGAKAADVADALFPKVSEKRDRLQALIDQGAWKKGNPGYASYLKLDREYEELLARYNGVLATAKAFRAEMDARNSIGGIVVTARGDHPPIGGADAAIKALQDRAGIAQSLFAQLEERGDDTARVFRELLDLQLQIEAAIRRQGDALTENRVTLLDLSSENWETLLGKAPAAQLATPTRYEYSGEYKTHLVPRPTGAMVLDTVSAGKYPVVARDTAPVTAAANDFEQAGQIAVASLGAMAQAAVTGTQQMEAVVIQGFAQIAAAAVQQTHPILGTAITAVGGLLGALFGRRSETRPTPVSVESYGSRALQQQKKTGPDVIRVLLVDSTTGEQTELLGYELGRSERRDAIVRVPRRR